MSAPYFAPGFQPNFQPNFNPVQPVVPAIPAAPRRGVSFGQIAIVLLLILLIAGGLLVLFLSRNALSRCERNEHPYCPELACLNPDPDPAGCGTSAFRIVGGAKVCKSTPSQ